MCGIGADGSADLNARPISHDSWDRDDEATVGDLEYRAVAVRATRVGGAEQVAIRVSDQPADGVSAVGGVEGSQGGRCAGIAATGFHDLEYRAVSVRPNPLGGYQAGPLPRGEEA